MKSTWEGILRLILNGFWSILVPKLASKMDGKSIKKIDVHMDQKNDLTPGAPDKKKMRFGRF